MLEFMLMLQQRGLTVYLSDYHRIRLALSTGGQWSLLRLRETLRALLVRDVAHDDSFDRSFQEHFGEVGAIGLESGGIDIDQLLGELGSREGEGKDRAGRPGEQGHGRWTEPGHWGNLEADPEAKKRPGLFSRLVSFIRGKRTSLAILILTFLLISAGLLIQRIYTYFFSGQLAGRFAWIIPLAGALVGLGLVVYNRYNERIKAWFARRASRKKPEHISEYSGQREYVLEMPLPPLASEAFLQAAADDVGYFFSEEDDEIIDVQTSIDQSCLAGVPQVIYAKKRKVREVLILIQEGAAEQMIYHLPAELLQGIGRRGIPVQFGHFENVPAAFITSDRTRIRLEDLEDNRNGYLVLLFGDSSFVDPGLHRFELENLRLWPSMAWFEVRPQNSWDSYTGFVSEYLPVYPATRRGVRDYLSRMVSERRRQPRALETSAGRFLSLDHHLGESLAWACTCALYQPMHPGVAEAIRREFFSYIDQEDIQRILAIPGVRKSAAGFYFSPRVQAELVGIMRDRWPERETLWRKWIDHCLAKHRPDVQSAAYLKWQHDKAFNLLDIDSRAAREGGKLLLDLQHTPLSAFSKSELVRARSVEGRSVRVALRDIDRDLRTRLALEKIAPVKSPWEEMSDKLKAFAAGLRDSWLGPLGRIVLLLTGGEGRSIFWTMARSTTLVLTHTDTLLPEGVRFRIPKKHRVLEIIKGGFVDPGVTPFVYIDDGPPPSEAEPLERFLGKEGIAATHRPKYLFLLGEPGMGKTRSLYNYFYGNAANYWAEKQVVLLPADIVDLDGIIPQIPDPEKIVLFIDAFDNDQKAQESALDRLAGLVNLTAKFHKVIIASRTAVFPEDKGIASVAQIADINGHSGSGNPQAMYSRLYLTPFEPGQIEEFYDKRYNNWWQHSRRKEGKRLAALLPELAGCPQMLAYIGDIVESAASLNGPSPFSGSMGAVKSSKEIQYGVELFPALLIVIQRAIHALPGDVGIRDLFSHQRVVAVLESVAYTAHINDGVVGMDDWRKHTGLFSGQSGPNSPSLAPPLDTLFDSFLQFSATGKLRFRDPAIADYLAMSEYLKRQKKEGSKFGWTPLMKRLLIEIIRLHNERTIPLPFDLDGVDLSHADMQGIRLPGVKMIGINFVATDLRNADLSGAILDKANLAKSSLVGANLLQASLSQANLASANLRAAVLAEANLREANLAEVDLRDADLRNADLRDANLANSPLEGVQLEGAKLDRANLAGTRLRQLDSKEAVAEQDRNRFFEEWALLAGNARDAAADVAMSGSWPIIDTQLRAAVDQLSVFMTRYEELFNDYDVNPAAASFRNKLQRYYSISRQAFGEKPKRADLTHHINAEFEILDREYRHLREIIDQG